MDTALCTGSRSTQHAGFAMRSLPDLAQLGRGYGEQQPGTAATLSGLHGIEVQSEAVLN